MSMPNVYSTTTCYVFPFPQIYIFHMHAVHAHKHTVYIPLSALDFKVQYVYLLIVVQMKCIFAYIAMEVITNGKTYNMH
jgi:hypothetical protein